MVHKKTSVANFQFDSTQHEKATKFAIITTSWSIGISELIINLSPKFNRSNTVAERSKESEFSAKIIECEITREENQFLFLGSRMCFSPSKSSNLAPSAMQKKINTEFTRASDDKCTSESVPQTSDKMNMWTTKWVQVQHSTHFSTSGQSACYVFCAWGWGNSVFQMNVSSISWSSSKEISIDKLWKDGRTSPLKSWED